MKHVTLSIPEDLMEKARQYAKENGTLLNKLILVQLKKLINDSENGDFHTTLKYFQSKISITTGIKIERESLYER